MQWGPVILLMHEYALLGHGTTIHSCLQIEHAKVKVDECALRLGGTQSVTFPSGHVIPLDIIDGLAYMKMTVPTDADLMQYPHISLTLDQKWDSRLYNATLSDDLDWFDTVMSVCEGEQYYPFKLDGEYKYKEGDSTLHEFKVNLHTLHHLNDRYVPDKEYDINTMETREASPPVKLKKSDIQYEELRPYFLNAPRHMVPHTYKNTTQLATCPYPGPNMYATWKSPFPAMNVCH